MFEIEAKVRVKKDARWHPAIAGCQATVLGYRCPLILGYRHLLILLNDGHIEQVFESELELVKEEGV